MKKRQLVRITKKRSLKTGRLSDFASCHVNAVYSAAESEERARCFLRSSLFLFLQLLLGSISFRICFSGFDRFRFLTLEPLEIDVLYKLWKRHFPRFRSGLESSSSQVLKSIF